MLVRDGYVFGNAPAAKVECRHELADPAGSIGHGINEAVRLIHQQNVAAGWWSEHETFALEVRYLEMRGLIERKEGAPHLIQFREESEAING